MMTKRERFVNSDHASWSGAERNCSAVFPVDTDGVQVSSDLNARGQEIPDSVPMAPPVGFSTGPSLAEFVQRMIRTEVSRAAAQEQLETFEEADDFDIEDDPLDPLTEYEKVFDRPPSVFTREEWEASKKAPPPKLTAEEWDLVEKFRGQTAGTQTASISGEFPVPAGPSPSLSKSLDSVSSPTVAGVGKSGSGSSE